MSEPRVKEIESKVLKRQIEVNGNIYTIEKKIGGGGVSEAFSAKTKDGKTICLKFLNPRKDIGMSDDIKKRFKNEYEVLKSISNERIVEVYKYGNIEEHEYFVMKYYDKGNLKEYLRNRNFTIDIKIKIDIFMQICEGVYYINKEGIHRDLKPDNILITSIEPIKIAISDFGTYYSLNEEIDNVETRKEDHLGSLVYIPPAQKDKSVKTSYLDIYALGIIFYQMLIDDTYESRLKPLSNIKGLDDEQIYLLQSIIYKMCNNNYKKSYESIVELCKDLYNKIIKYDSKLKNAYIPAFLKESINNSLDLSLMDEYILKWKFNPENSTPKKYDQSITTSFNVGQPIINNDFILFIWKETEILCFDLYTGNEIWRKKYTNCEFISTPIVFDEKVVCINTQGVLYCLDIYNGNEEWNLELLQEDNIYDEERRYYTAPLKIFNNILMAISNEGNIKFVDLYSKNVKNGPYISTPYKNSWLSDSYYNIHEVIQSENNFYINTSDSISALRNIKFDNNKNEYAWEHYFSEEEKLSNEIYWKEQEAIFNNEQIISILKESKIEGKFTWRHSLEKKEVLSEVAYNQNNIFFSTSSGKVSKLSLETGEVVWTIDLGREIATPIEVDNDFLIIITIDGYINIIFNADGKIYKTKKIEQYNKEEVYYSKPLISQNRRVLVLKDNNLKILDFNTLETIFENYDIGYNPTNTILVNNYLLIPTEDGLTVYSGVKK